MSPRSERAPKHPRPGSPRARLFVALELPDDAREELAEWRHEAFADRDDVRLPDSATLHITLAFLGYRPEKEIERIAELTGLAAGRCPAPVVAATAVKPLPPRRPRLFALDLDDRGGAAVALQAVVSDALEAERIYTPEKRPFWPHITLARVKRDRVAVAPEAELPHGEWRCGAVTLYRSTLRPQGAVYDVLARTRLG